MKTGDAGTDSGGKPPPVRRKAPFLRLVVLVPHRDSRRLVEARRSSLFAAGLTGTWSFPVVAPLAHLSRSLTPPELKALAAFLREASLAGGRDGRITAGEPADFHCPGPDGGPDGGPQFWGPVLDTPVPVWEDIRAPETTGLRAGTPPVYSPFPAAILCAALVPGGVPPGVSLPAMPAFSFRAAAAANMVISPLTSGAPGYSFRWRIGRLFWLPKNTARHSRLT